MSCMRSERVWRVPCERYHITDPYRETPNEWLEWWEDDWGAYGGPWEIDRDELEEEYEELFTWDEGGFRPALCPGGYLDYVLFSAPAHYGDYRSRYDDTSRDVFRTILPDADLDDVHFCEYSWYDGTDAPERY